MAEMDMEWNDSTYAFHDSFRASQETQHDTQSSSNSFDSPIFSTGPGSYDQTTQSLHTTFDSFDDPYCPQQLGFQGFPPASYPLNHDFQSLDLQQSVFAQNDTTHPEFIFGSGSSLSQNENSSGAPSFNEPSHSTGPVPLSSSQDYSMVDRFLREWLATHKCFPQSDIMMAWAVIAHTTVDRIQELCETILREMGPPPPKQSTSVSAQQASTDTFERFKRTFASRTDRDRAIADVINYRNAKIEDSALRVERYGRQCPRESQSARRTSNRPGVNTRYCIRPGCTYSCQSDADFERHLSHTDPHRFWFCPHDHEKPFVHHVEGKIVEHLREEHNMSSEQAKSLKGDLLVPCVDDPETPWRPEFHQPCGFCGEWIDDGYIFNRYHVPGHFTGKTMVKRVARKFTKEEWDQLKYYMESICPDEKFSDLVSQDCRHPDDDDDEGTAGGASSSSTNPRTSFSSKGKSRTSGGISKQKRYGSSSRTSGSQRQQYCLQMLERLSPSPQAHPIQRSWFGLDLEEAIYADYQQTRNLFDGREVVVNEVQHKSTGHYYAQKTVWHSEKRASLQERFFHETSVMKKISHPHLAQLIDARLGERTFSLFIHPVGDASLRDYLANPSSSTDQEMWNWFGCMTSAVTYLHSSTTMVCHQDIKPANILIKGSKVFLCDFGISRDFSDADSTTMSSGPMTPLYAAPEVIRHDRHGTRADIFSLGCTFLEMLTWLCGESIEQYHRSLKSTGKQQSKGHEYQGWLKARLQWISHLETLKHRDAVEEPQGSEHDLLPTINTTLQACKTMLRGVAAERPTAVDLEAVFPHPEGCGHTMPSVNPPQLHSDEDHSIAQYFASLGNKDAIGISPNSLRRCTTLFPSIERTQGKLEEIASFLLSADMDVDEDKSHLMVKWHLQKAQMTFEVAYLAALGIHGPRNGPSKTQREPQALESDLLRSKGPENRVQGLPAINGTPGEPLRPLGIFSGERRSQELLWKFARLFAGVHGRLNELRTRTFNNGLERLELHAVQQELQARLSTKGGVHELEVHSQEVLTRLLKHGGQDTPDMHNKQQEVRAGRFKNGDLRSSPKLIGEPPRPNGPGSEPFCSPSVQHAGPYRRIEEIEDNDAPFAPVSANTAFKRHLPRESGSKISIVADDGIHLIRDKPDPTQQGCTWNAWSDYSENVELPAGLDMSDYNKQRRDRESGNGDATRGAVDDKI